MSKERTTESPAHLRLVSDLLNAISSYTKKVNRQVSGNAQVERTDGKDEPPMVVMYHANSRGHYMCWFADDGKMHLYAKQDGAVRRIISVKVSEMGAMQAAIDKLRPQLDDTFKPKKKKKSS